MSNVDLKRLAMLDWNDLRFFLGVARAGSTLAASKRMRVSQATVSRRIGVLEEALGAKLFIREPSGYTLTPRGQAVLPAAEAVEASIASLTHLVDAETRRLAGNVRVTTVEGAAYAWVYPALASFSKEHPDVRAEVIVNERNLDIARGEVDIAIRFGSPPTEDTLIVKRLLDLEETVYARRDLVERLGMPQSYAELARYPVVGMSADVPSPISAWYEREAPGAEVVQRSNTVSGVIAAMRAGIGAAVIPCLMGDSISSLIRLFPPVGELTTPGWIVTTEFARQQPHIRALIDHLVTDIQRVLREGEELSAIARAA